jgi:hypothetical protein
MDILPVETILETEAALLEADRACEVAESRLAELKGLLKQMRAERDYWRDQAQLTAIVGGSRYIDLSFHGGSERSPPSGRLSGHFWEAFPRSPPRYVANDRGRGGKGRR